MYGGLRLDQRISKATIQPGTNRWFRPLLAGFARFHWIPACPLLSGFLPRAVHNEISAMCPQQTFDVEGKILRRSTGDSARLESRRLRK